MSERRSLLALCLLPVVEESSYLQGVPYMELAVSRTGDLLGAA
jgi:hypothetical protein